MGTERKTVDYWEKRYEKSKESIPLLNSLCTEVNYSVIELPSFLLNRVTF